jgi:hypothetical protein
MPRLSAAQHDLSAGFEARLWPRFRLYGKLETICFPADYRPVRMFALASGGPSP